MEVDNVAQGSFGSTGYVRNNSGHEESSLHIREEFELPAGATLTVGIQRAASAKTTIMRGAGARNINISKLLLFHFSQKQKSATLEDSRFFFGSRFSLLAIESSSK